MRVTQYVSALIIAMSGNFQKVLFNMGRIPVSLMALLCFVGNPMLAVAQTMTVTVASTPTTTIHDTGMPIASGWNLVGTGQGGTLHMSSFTAPTRVTTVWKWVRDTSRWAFYAPSLDAQGGTVLADYAASQGYEVLTAINPGEGFWVHASQAFFLSWNSGGEISSTSFQEGKPGALRQGWNLIAICPQRTPGEFNLDIGVSPLVAGVAPVNLTTLWAWDNLQSKWYFYSPSLEAKGGTVLRDYIASQGYLDFTTNNKILGPWMGFWVNKP